MSAVISPCGLYRYELTRDIGGGEGKCIFIMLNPSTADATLDDPTIRRCVGFARRFERAQLVVLNLFALRSSSPTVLRNGGDVVGPDNWKHFEQRLNAHPKPDLVICAWGTHGGYLDQDKTVMGWLDSWAIDAQCLGVTNNGFPRHPLYARGNTPLRPFEGRR